MPSDVDWMHFGQAGVDWSSVILICLCVIIIMIIIGQLIEIRNSCLVQVAGHGR